MSVLSAKKITHRGGIWLRLVPYIYPFTAYQGAETLSMYMIWICEALQVGFEANHDETTSDRLVPTLKFLKIDP